MGDQKARVRRIMGNRANRMTEPQKQAMLRLEDTIKALMAKYPDAGKLSEDVLARDKAGLPVSQEDQDTMIAIATEVEEAWRQGGKELGLSEEDIEKWLESKRRADSLGLSHFITGFTEGQHRHG
jgi:hypothetical protein